MEALVYTFLLVSTLGIIFPFLLPHFAQRVEGR